MNWNRVTKAINIEVEILDNLKAIQKNQNQILDLREKTLDLLEKLRILDLKTFREVWELYKDLFNSIKRNQHE